MRGVVEKMEIWNNRMDEMRKIKEKNEDTKKQRRKRKEHE